MTRIYFTLAFLQLPPGAIKTSIGKALLQRTLVVTPWDEKVSLKNLYLFLKVLKTIYFDTIWNDLMPHFNLTVLLPRIKPCEYFFFSNFLANFATNPQSSLNARFANVFYLFFLWLQCSEPTVIGVPALQAESPGFNSQMNHLIPNGATCELQLCTKCFIFTSRKIFICI